MQLPIWYDDASAGERLQFLLGICACHATKEGTLVDMANAVGFNPGLVAHWKKSGAVPVKWAALIEGHVGRNVVKWEMLARPCNQE